MIATALGRSASPNRHAGDTFSRVLLETYDINEVADLNTDGTVGPAQLLASWG